MDTHSEETNITEVLEQEISFSNGLYDAIWAIKEDAGVYIALLIFSFLLKYQSIVNFNSQDDMTVILTTLINAVGSFIQAAFILNFFYFRFKGERLKIAKVLWDIPTFVFYSIVSSMLILLGFVLFFIPGLYCFYYYSNVSVTAILFDEEEKSNFKLTKKKVSQLGGTYALFLLAAIVISLVTMAIVSIAPGAGIHVSIVLVFAFVLSFVQDILAGMLVSLFKKVS